MHSDASVFQSSGDFAQCCAVSLQDGPVDDETWRAKLIQLLSYHLFDQFGLHLCSEIIEK